MGYISGLIKPNTGTVTITDKLEFSLNNIMLSQGVDGSYSAKIYLDDTLKLKENLKYEVNVNEEPCSKIDFSTGTNSYIRAEYVYTFLDDELNPLCTDTLVFNISFFDYSTEIKITTSGGQTAVDYWNTYFSKNDFKVNVKVSDYERDSSLVYGEGDYSNYFVLTYMVDDEEYLTQIFDSKQTVALIEAPDKFGYVFSHWVDSNGNKVNQTSNLNSNITLYAVYIEAEALPWTIDGDTITGYTGTSTELIFPTSYSIGPNGKYIAGEDYQIKYVKMDFTALDVAVKRIIYPSGVTHKGSFYIPDGLEYLEYQGLTNIYNRHFEYYSGNLDLVLNFDYVSILQLYEYPSALMNGTINVYVPDDLVDDYKSAEGWSEISSKIYAISEYKA